MGFEIFETNASESEELLHRNGGYFAKSHLNRVFILATRMGFEPTTSAVTGRHSNQLNYRAKNHHKMINMVEVTGLEPVTPCL